MALKIDTKFEGKMTCAFKNDMRDLANFYQSTREFQTGTLMGLFYPKQKMQELKMQGGVMCDHIYYVTMKDVTKFEEELTCEFKIDMINLTNFDPSTQKSQKFTL